jgi:PAS domain S-box-containing protein
MDSKLPLSVKSSPEASPRLPWFRRLDGRDHFRTLLADLRAVVTEIDSRGRITFVTAGVEQVSGYAAAELIGTNAWRSIHPDDLERLKTRTAAETGSTRRRITYRTRHKAGHWNWMETVWGTHYDTPSASRRRVVVTRDITHLKNARDALRATEERYRTVIESAEDIVTEHDTTGSVVFTSPNIEAILGYSPDEMTGLSSREFIHPAESERVARHFTHAYSSRLPTRFEAYRVRHAEGHWVWLQSTGISYQDRNNETRFLNISRDITPLVIQAQERKDFEARAEQAKRLESFGIMAGGVAHDFNNLLTPLLADTSFALSALPRDSPLAQRMQRVEHAVQRTSELTHQMLSYAGSGKFEPKRLDLTDVIQRARQALEATAGEKADLAFELADEIPPILSDPNSIIEAISSLVSNAVEATSSGRGRIVIRTGLAQPLADLAVGFPIEPPPRECVFLEVSDNGVGMDDTTRGQIFDPFFTTHFHGRGLGLASLLGIVRAHSAAVELETTPGEGTRLRILIPKYEEAKPSRSERATGQTRFESDRGTILIVEDDAATRELVEEIFHAEGFQTVTAADGAAGVHALEEHERAIDLVLLDFTLPDQPSADVVKQLHERQPGCKVLLISGHSKSRATAPFSPEDLAGFLSKPFLPDDLVSAANALLGAPARVPRA